MMKKSRGKTRMNPLGCTPTRWMTVRESTKQRRVLPLIETAQDTSHGQDAVDAKSQAPPPKKNPKGATKSATKPPLLNPAPSASTAKVKSKGVSLAPVAPKRPAGKFAPLVPKNPASSKVEPKTAKDATKAVDAKGKPAAARRRAPEALGKMIKAIESSDEDTVIDGEQAGKGEEGDQETQTTAEPAEDAKAKDESNDGTAKVQVSVLSTTSNG
jgi:hypothetical protein